MKTALDIDDQLLTDTKMMAVKQRTSLTRLIEEGLRLRLRASAAVPRGRALLPVFKGVAAWFRVWTRSATGRCTTRSAMAPDVNVLVSASRDDHPRHSVARIWLEQSLGACASGAASR